MHPGDDSIEVVGGVRCADILKAGRRNVPHEARLPFVEKAGSATLEVEEEETPSPQACTTQCEGVKFTNGGIV